MSAGKSVIGISFCEGELFVFRPELNQGMVGSSFLGLSCMNHTRLFDQWEGMGSWSTLCSDRLASVDRGNFHHFESILPSLDRAIFHNMSMEHTGIDTRYRIRILP